MAFEKMILESGPLIHLSIRPGIVPRLTLSGPINHFYQIEYTPIIGTNTWERAGEVYLKDCADSWFAPKPTNAATAFYRAVLLP
jgi:hypothetical protein